MSFTVLGPKIGFPNLLDHLTVQKMGKAKSKYNPIRPSNAGRCARELAYDTMEYRGKAEYKAKETDPTSHRIFDMGYAVESHLGRQFQQAFEQSETEIKIKYKQQVLSFFRLSTGEMLEGSLDGVFLSKQYGTYIDYKSKKDKFSQSFKTDWDETAGFLKSKSYITEFDDEAFWVQDLDQFLKDLKERGDYYWAMNFYQLNYYYFDKGEFLKSRGIDHGSLLYYNKNDSRLREIRFKPSQAVADQTQLKFEQIDKAVAAGNPELVEKEHVLGSMACAFCRHADKCWENEDNLQAWFDTFPPKTWPKDTNRLKEVGQEVEDLYQVWNNLTGVSADLEKAETALTDLLVQNKLYKVRFADGLIYEIKKLKTGGAYNGPRVVLRKGKL